MEFKEVPHSSILNDLIKEDKISLNDINDYLEKYFSKISPSLYESYKRGRSNYQSNFNTFNDSMFSLITFITEELRKSALDKGLSTNEVTDAKQILESLTCIISNKKIPVEMNFFLSSLLGFIIIGLTKFYEKNNS